MPTLRELQSGIAAALLDGSKAAEAWIIADDIAPATRLEVHRNTVFVSLTEALAATFRAIECLVDPRFFAYAAHEFIRAHPPRRPSLAEYGADFPAFLAGFEPCRDLAYLPDVARLEWAIAGVARAVEAPSLTPDGLAGISDAAAERLVFAFQPTIALIASQFPIDAIWRANRPDGSEEAVDLAEGPVRLELRALRQGVVLRRLDAAVFAFRSALAEGRTLGAASEAALARNPAFDLAGAFADLFRDGAVVAAASESRKEN